MDMTMNTADYFFPDWGCLVDFFCNLGLKNFWQGQIFEPTTLNLSSQNQVPLTTWPRQPHKVSGTLKSPMVWSVAERARGKWNLQITQQRSFESRKESELLMIYRSLIMRGGIYFREKYLWLPSEEGVFIFDKLLQIVMGMKSDF